MRVPVVSRFLRRRRIDQLVSELGDLEAAMRDRCAQLLELTEPGDDLHVAVVRLLEGLEG